MPPPITSSRFGRAVERQRAGRVDHPRVVVRDERQRHRLGAGRDDRLLEADRLRAAVASTSSWFGGGEAAVAGDHGDLALLGQPRQAAGQLLDHPVLPAAQLVDVDRGVGEADAVRRHVLRLVDDLGGVQQRLRRDAADVEAHAAERRPALDQHYLLAEVGGPERGGVAARTRAEHEHLGVVVALRGDRRRGGRRRRRSPRRRGCAAGRMPRRRAGACERRRSGRPRETRSPVLTLTSFHGLRLRSRHFHGGLIGLQRDQRVLGLDRRRRAATWTSMTGSP